MGLLAESVAHAYPSLPGTRPSFLMCSPEDFGVNYIINPWMTGNLHLASRELALEQWRQLHNALAQFANVEVMSSHPGSPDIVFTANAGLSYNGTVVLSRFLYPERQLEESHFRRWFEEGGYKVVELPRGVFFEGEGDALFSCDHSRLWAGYGQRTSRLSHPHLARAWNVEVISLCLVDPRFYHLDTCFAPLANNYVVYYPAAFDAVSLEQIEAFYPEETRIIVSENDAVRFACNVVNIDRTLILNHVSPELNARLMSSGFDVIQLSFTEFLKAGGAAKCLVMHLSGEAGAEGSAGTKS